VLKEANNLCLRLWKDESGVVLAITVVVFLTLFLMACSVYAVGETIRQRVEVQNACDAAAYSAAVVQADSMSRIGAINRAMVWTYAQLVKRDMDLIVDAWLTRAYIEWLIDKIVAQLINSLGMCGKGHPYWLVGAPFHWESMRLNRHISVDADEVLQAVMGFLGQKIINLVMIESYKSNIQAMNAAIDDIIARMPDRIEHTVEEILQANIADTWNDTLSPAGRADIMYALIQEDDPAGTYFRVEKGEPEFFTIADIHDYKAYFDRGFDLWFKQKPADGMLHGYEEQPDHLVADWWTTSHLGIEIWGICVPIRVIWEEPDENEVWGSDVENPKYFETVEARVRALLPNFFGKDGTLVVGLSRRMNNPLQFFAPGTSGGDRSMYNAFTLNDDSRFMWTASAARAGYHFEAPPPSQVPNELGDYQATYWHDPDKQNPNGFLDNIPHWNIKWGDWDAIMLPLRRAWYTGENGQWKGGQGAAQLLGAVEGESWKALPAYGGGGALGTQSAPQLMGGGNMNIAGAENDILH